MSNDDLTLADLRLGQHGEVISIDSDDGAFKRRMMSLGIIPGGDIALDRSAPLGDPRIYTVLGYNLGLRNVEARQVHVCLK